MGEYLTSVSGEYLAKAGVMDDFRYVRRSELEHWSPLDGGKGTDCKEVLADLNTLYRFPFPWEDPPAEIEIDFGRIDQRDLFKTQTVYGWNPPAAVTHKEIVQPLKGKHMAQGINVWLPCPIGTPSYPLKTSFGGATPAINIVGERYDQWGHGRTIFACAWCQAMFSLDQAELLNLMQFMTDRIAPNEHWMPEVIRRLKAAPRPVSPSP
jgi:hypothetical protein